MISARSFAAALGVEVPGAGLGCVLVGCADVLADVEAFGEVGVGAGVCAVVVGCADVEAFGEVGAVVATVVVADVVGCASVGVDADFGVRSPVVVPSGRPTAVSYTHLTLPTTSRRCRSRWSPYH